MQPCTSERGSCLPGRRSPSGSPRRSAAPRQSQAFTDSVWSLLLVCLFLCVFVLCVCVCVCLFVVVLAAEQLRLPRREEPHGLRGVDEARHAALAQLYGARPLPGGEGVPLLSAEAKSERPPSAQGPYVKTYYVEQMPHEPKELCPQTQLKQITSYDLWSWVVLTWLRPPPGRPTCGAGAPRGAPRLQTNVVNTNEAAAKVIGFDRLGKKVQPGTLGNIQVDGSTQKVPQSKNIKQMQWSREC